MRGNHFIMKKMGICYVLWVNLLNEKFYKKEEKGMQKVIFIIVFIVVISLICLMFNNAKIQNDGIIVSKDGGSDINSQERQLENEEKVTTTVGSASSTHSAGIFTPEDTKVLGIEIDMKKEEVEEILGEPYKTESHYEDAFDGDVLTYYYHFGSIRMEPLDETEYTVSHIIDKPGLEGPRGIKVNDAIDTVIAKFPFSNEFSKDDSNRQMIYGSDEENCGYIVYDTDGNISELVYDYGGGGFGTYSLVIEVMDNKVKLITIGVMNV